MAYDDADVSADMADQDELLRLCERCNAVMKQLGKLPALSLHAAIKVFRCYDCDYVVADQV